MNNTTSTRTPQPVHRERETEQPHDRFARFDDEALERALRTVSWNPKDVANFLRSHATR